MVFDSAHKGRAFIKATEVFDLALEVLD